MYDNSKSQIFKPIVYVSILHYIYSQGDSAMFI